MKAVMTVRGPIAPEELGVTLMHEHLELDLSVYFEEDPAAPELRDAPVSIELLHRLRRRPFGTTRDNMTLGGVEIVADEIQRFLDAGGRSICEVSTIGMGRDPIALKALSERTGVNVVMGGGLYIDPSHPAWTRDKSIDELADLFARDVLEGVDGTGIRSGIIGEIGTSAVPGSDGAVQVTPSEEKALRAAARAGLRTGAAVSVHLAITGYGAHRAIDILEDEGLPVDRMVMGHMDTFEDLDYHLAVAERGVYVEYDCLGREYWTDELGHRPWGHDSWRVRFISELVARGYGSRLLLSQDIALKFDLCQFGGVGYAHVPNVIVPMLRRHRVSDQDIRRMLVDNPREVLTIDVDGEKLVPAAG